MSTQAYALLSVSNKQNLETIAEALLQAGYSLLATGNTARHLKKHNIPTTEISDFTAQPEILGGRVKSLHPKIHGGILARTNIDQVDIDSQSLSMIDFVIANLYPFEKVISTDHKFSEAIENIDIGGPALLRAAAKNFNRVTAICDYEDYPKIIAELKQSRQTTLETRQECAGKVFATTAAYDEQIRNYFSAKTFVTIKAEKNDTLRYGENPQQTAQRYAYVGSQHNCLARADSWQGKELSFNNLLDANAAWQCVCEFSEPTCVIVKHNTPCGVASAITLSEAYNKALRCDSQSAFGGIIACNKEMDAETAKQVAAQFVEVIIAPSFSSEAKDIIAHKKNCRTLVLDPPSQKNDLIYSIDGGFLRQSINNAADDYTQWQTVTTKTCSAAQVQDLKFSWQVIKHIKSNAILFAGDQATLGIGCGQTSRIFSLEIAALKAKHAGLDLNGSVMASDAFFPFADAIDMAAKLKISAIIQPGGSKRDNEVIDCANKHNMAMIFTGRRNFKH